MKPVTAAAAPVPDIDIAEAEGLRVVQCITIVDREEGAAERLAEAGHTLEVLVRRAELEN